MREIKFRGRQTKPMKSIWHYGDLMHSKDNKTYIQNFCIMEVDENTIGQYTGLHDKNRKEIYEGDIIQHLHEYSDITDRYLVIWDEDELRYAFQNVLNKNNFIALEDMWDDYYGDYSLEVIGDIYDNPELLKGEINERNI